ncbi:DUF1672 family protein, partial [Staphylococcus aureus]
PAEKDAIEFAKKHKDKIAKRGEQFFMDNFGLKVKATNVVGSGDGVEVYVHCDDHDIVFNASIPFDKSIIDSDSSLRSEDKGDDTPAEKDAIEFAKKHKDKIAKRGEQFFMDNFGLKVKATNVVGSGDGVEVYVHCDDHDIVFNASIPFDKSIIDSDSSLRSEDKGDD